MHHSDGWVKEVGCAGAETKWLIHDSHLRLHCQTRVTAAQRADLQEAEKCLQTLYCHLPENNIWLQLSESWLKKMVQVSKSGDLILLTVSSWPMGAISWWCLGSFPLTW